MPPETFAMDWPALAPAGPAALAALAMLPLLRPHTLLTGSSSHDVTGWNNDGFNSTYSYLYRDGGDYVLFDEEGPGCVYVIRTICHKGNMKVYLDGAAEPSLEIPFVDLHAGKRPPFVAPFVAFEQGAHGSSWCYVPIPFQKSCKITTDEMEAPHFLTISAHRFAPGTPVAAFDLNAPLDKAAAWWRTPQRLPEDLSSMKTDSGTLAVAPRQWGKLLDLQGAGAIRALKMRFPGKDLHAAAKLKIRAQWDALPTPGIDSPASTFFGLGCPRALDALNNPDPAMMETERFKCGRVPVRSLFVGEDEDGWLYCHFPMPYWESARIDVLNESFEAPIDIEYSVVRSETAYPVHAGYFHALWREENPVRFGEDFCVLDTQGEGHYVGCVLTITSPQRPPDDTGYPVRGHLEGDARFYIDGNRTPFVASTGTEEYFNWGWYDVLPHDETFTYPMHGYPLHVVEREDHSVMYRFHAGEIVPFHRAFRFDLEHGGAGTDTGRYSGTAFFYRRPEAALVPADELDVADRTSEAAHEYNCKGEVREERHTAPYEGSRQLPKAQDDPRDREAAVKDTGRVWKKSCRFTLSIRPDNDGVKLRRRSYYGFGANGDLSVSVREQALLTAPQRVAVSVDGEEVGDWYVPAGHARDTWRDTEFELPAGTTRGKEKIVVTLTAKDDTQWDEYAYWAYTYLAR